MYPKVNVCELLANKQRPVDYEAIDKAGSCCDINALDFDFAVARTSRAKWYGGIAVYRNKYR